MWMSLGRIESEDDVLRKRKMQKIDHGALPRGFPFSVLLDGCNDELVDDDTLV